MKKSKFILGLSILVIIALAVFIFSSTKSTDGGGVGWSRKCQVSSDCAFVERISVPVPGPEGCYSIKENPAIQSQNLVSSRNSCECINNICQVKN